MILYRMTIYKYSEVGERYLHIPNQEQPLFKTKEAADQHFKNQWYIKEKIGYYDKSYYTLEEINTEDLV